MPRAASRLPVAAVLLLAACSQGRPGDAELQRFAQEGWPLFRGLDKCRATYGKFPPTSETMIGCLPGGASARGRFVMIGNWILSPDRGGDGYTATRKLSETAMLMRHCSLQACRWIYDPGPDGQAVEVNLEQTAQR